MFRQFKFTTPWLEQRIPGSTIETSGIECPIIFIIEVSKQVLLLFPAIYCKGLEPTISAEKVGDIILIVEVP